MTIETPGPLFAPFRLTVTGLVSREQLELDIEQPVVLGWDTLSDRSMSCCVGSRAASDRKPNGWLQAVLALKEKYASCGDLPLLQGSVVQGVELIRGVVLPEFAAIRKKRSFARPLGEGSRILNACLQGAGLHPAAGRFPACCRRSVRAQDRC
jgi:hypothetical protein